MIGWPKPPRERYEQFGLNPFSPLANGLVFAGLGRVQKTDHYRDSSLYGNHGSLVGYSGAGDLPSDRWTWDSTLKRAVLGGDGSDDYALLPSSSVWIGEEISVCCWGYATNSSSTYENIFGNREYETAQTWLIFRDGTAVGVQIFGVGLSPFISTSFGPGIWTSGAWHHIAFTYKSGDQRYYFDGKEESSGTATGTMGAISKQCAFLKGYENCFNGRGADPLVWRRVLASSEISALANPANTDLRIGNTPLILPPVRRLWPVAVTSGGTTSTITLPLMQVTI